MHFLYPFVVILILIRASILPLPGQVLINEYSCANISIIADADGDFEDYIEIFNSGTTAIDLASFYLSDRISNPLKWQFPASIILNPGDFLLVFASSKNAFLGGHYHTNFNLTQTRNEHIVLSNASGVIIDQLQIIRTQVNHSRGRSPDGASFFSLFLAPTPANANASGSEEYSPTPIFSLQAGAYSGTISLSLINPEPGASLRYTIDGSVPNTTSTLYSGPINIAQTTVVKARVFSINPAIPISFVETNTYFIDVNHNLPVLSLSGNQLGSLFGGNQTIRIGSLEYFDENLNFIDESTGEFNKHGNDSWAYQQRGVDFICRDQYGYNAELRDQIFPIKQREDYQRLIIKAAANDNYPFANGAHIRDAYVQTLSQLANLNLDERTSKFCVVYMNGQYWGLYDMREKVDDHDFTDFYYDQNKNDLQFLKTWGGTWSEYGGPQAQADWVNLRTFILGNDMSIAANFANVDSFYDWKSLIDYVVLNSYIVCSDWLNWNTGWWRGLNANGGALKWRYILWDMDASFGHYINYTGIPNTGSDADPCDPEFLNNPGGQGHVPILNQLMTNETFSQYYISRYIDLSNSYLNCNFMQYALDSMLAVIEPEMPAQIQRWGGTIAGWETNVLELKNFIDDRCTELAEGLIDCYDITGPYNLVFKVEPENAGTIQINSLFINQFPFEGTYFGDIDLLLEAYAEIGFIFDYWSMSNNTINPNISVAAGSINLIDGDTIIAIFKNPIPVVNLGNDTAICAGTSIVLNAGNPGASFIWSNGASSQILTINEAGSYAVTVSNLSFSTIDEISVSLNYPPMVSLEPEYLVCSDQIITLQSTSQHALDFLWSNSETSSAIQVTLPGNYWIEAYNDCGTDRDSTLVKLGYTPNIDLGPDLILDPGSSITLNASAPEAEYVWQDQTNLPYLTVYLPGYYWVMVTNICGTAFDDIQIYTVIVIDIPNAFSPNGDGLNDEFSYTSNGIVEENFSMKIYNRFGEKVFESNELNLFWDGKYKGNPAPDGVYIYLMNYQDFIGERHQKKGSLTLIR